MTYITGAIIGLAFGGVVGLLKNIFIWKKYLEKCASSNCQTAGVGGIYTRAMLSYFINILTLVVAFFIRNVIPGDGIAFLIATAVALTVMNKVLAIRQKKTEERWEGAAGQ